MPWPLAFDCPTCNTIFSTGSCSYNILGLFNLPKFTQLQQRRTKLQIMSPNSSSLTGKLGSEVTKKTESLKYGNFFFFKKVQLSGILKIAWDLHHDLARARLEMSGSDGFLAPLQLLQPTDPIPRKVTLLSNVYCITVSDFGIICCLGFSTPLLPFISGDNWELTAVVPTVVMGIWS